MRDGLADHVTDVYRLAMRMTRDVHRAEDLTQETFLRACQRGTQLKDSKAAKAWLFQIAVNLMNDAFRGKAGSDSRLSVLSEEVEPVDPDTTPDSKIETIEELEFALELLDQLPERQRVVLYLIAVEDFSLSEVCEILKISSNTAKANLSITRKRMRTELEKRDSSKKSSGATTLLNLKHR